MSDEQLKNVRIEENILQNVGTRFIISIYFMFENRDKEREN
jgi:hypothetical protein